MIRRLLSLAIICFCFPTWAGVQLLKLDSNDRIEPDLLADVVIKDLSATPTREPHHDVGLRLLINNVKYFIQPSMFMAKSRSGEVCNPTGEVLAYQCKEGQRFVKGCHLLFFDAEGKWSGWYTLNINEMEFAHYCNAMPAFGVANSEKNELLVTMQYFLVDGGGATKVSDLSSDWFRMTTLFRVKANNGKIEVEQDDACLGNPNRVETIPDARKRLRQCETPRK